MPKRHTNRAGDVCVWQVIRISLGDITQARRTAEGDAGCIVSFTGQAREDRSPSLAYDNPYCDRLLYVTHAITRVMTLTQALCVIKSLSDT